MSLRTSFRVADHSSPIVPFGAPMMNLQAVGCPTHGVNRPEMLTERVEQCRCETEAVIASSAKMIASGLTPPYALGSSDAEHERLIRQAKRIAPITERFFRDAGIGPGQRVLDVGSGVGDVAMLAANLVGPSGEVVGVERDFRSLARAKVRVAEAGLHNVSFTQCDVNQIASHQPFDAVVGRFILEFLPDPAAVLRSLSQSVHAGGIMAFQAPCWAPILAISTHLPLWSAAASLMCEIARRSRVNPEMGLTLYQTFREAGLPAPAIQMEVPLGNDPEFILWIYDILCSLRPQIERLDLPMQSLGDFATLPARLQAEVAASNGVVSWMAVVGAWCRME